MVVPAGVSGRPGRPAEGRSLRRAQNYDGKDTWWKKIGLDLKDLYGIDLKDDVAFPPGFQGDPNEFRMRDPLSHGVPDGDLRKHRDFAVWYATKWTRRVIDAIDQFSPDFIYFDGGGSYPFCGHGTGRGLRADATPRVIAHLYNKSIAKNGGRLEAMAFTKGNEDPRAVAVNCESQVPGDIKRDCTWQTENGLGEWFYLKGTFYDSGMVIHQMLEAISRDGNYAINIPLTPAGELDPGGLKTLQDMGDWMNVNSEGIHGSSAWDVWGEGKVAMAGGNLNESHARTPYTGQDIRFTAKNGAVYAWLMAWPAGGKVMIHSLAEGAGKIEEVKLLGCPVKLDWRQTEEELVVCLQKQRPCEFAYGLKIVGAQPQGRLAQGPCHQARCRRLPDSRSRGGRAPGRRQARVARRSDELRLLGQWLGFRRVERGLCQGRRVPGFFAGRMSLFRSCSSTRGRWSHSPGWRA